MTMDNKKEATERIGFENVEELNQRWEKEISKVKIVEEARIRAAITEDGEVKVSVAIQSKDLFFAIMNALSESNTQYFSEAAAAIASLNIMKKLAELSPQADEDDTPELQ